MCWQNAMRRSSWDYVKMLMKASGPIKEQRCACNGGTEPQICDFCSLALFPRWADLHIWHTCSYLFSVSLTALLSCCLSDAKEQKLSSEADLGGNLYLAGLAPALSGWLRNVPLRGAGFQLLGFDVTSNCTLMFVLISEVQRSAARKWSQVIWLLLSQSI